MNVQEAVEQQRLRDEENKQRRIRDRLRRYHEFHKKVIPLTYPCTSDTLQTEDEYSIPAESNMSVGLVTGSLSYTSANLISQLWKCWIQF